MEEKYKKFLEFNWAESQDWQMYYTNLSEIPKPDKVLHFKKRFYKLKIDPDFDTKWTPPQENNNTYSSGTSSQQNTGSSSANFNYSQNSPYTGSVSGLNYPILATIEALLWVGFGVSILLPSYTLKLVLLALLIRVVRRTGIPKFNMDYAQVLFLDEHFHLFLYALLLLIDRLNYFTLIPFGITALLNVSEYIRLNSANTLFASVLPTANKIWNQRVELAKMRANVEIGIGFLLIFGVFFGLNSFVLPLFYWQYLRFKYIVNNDLKLAFGRLNMVVENFKNKPSVPGVVKYVLTKIQDSASYLGRTEAAPGQAAGGANCVIF